MAIRLLLNFPYENQKCPLLFCRAGQDFRVPNSLALPVRRIWTPAICFEVSFPSSGKVSVQGFVR